MSKKYKKNKKLIYSNYIASFRKKKKKKLIATRRDKSVYIQGNYQPEGVVKKSVTKG